TSRCCSPGCRSIPASGGTRTGSRTASSASWSRPSRSRTDPMPMDLHARSRRLFAELQEEICLALERLDGKARFREDLWHNPEGGDGRASGGGATRVLDRGRVFEKAGVSLADVGGQINERLAARLAVEPQPFQGTGISLVLHPLSPLVPTVHMNLRFLQLLGGGGEKRAWFGGGADLTPYYLFE